jgi:site-specific DNA recombinase
MVDGRDMPDVNMQHMLAVMLLDGTASFAAAYDVPRLQDATGRRSVRGHDAMAAADSPAAGPSKGALLAAARRPAWLLSGLVRCGQCDGPLTVMGSGGRLGCANHVERGICDNRRTLLRDRLLPRVLTGLKQRLLAPELVEEFVRTYVAEMNAANRDRGARQAGLAQQQARLARQIRNLLELIKEGHGSPAMAAELRELEQRQAALAADIAAAGTPEPVPVLHLNLPELYRRKAEALEAALADPATSAAAAEALRGLIDAILVFPGERRGEVSVQLCGDLAAFLHLGDAPNGAAGGNAGSANSKKAVLRVGNGRSGVWREVLATLDAGTGFEPVTFRL